MTKAAEKKIPAKTKQSQELTKNSILFCFTPDYILALQVGYVEGSLNIQNKRGGAAESLLQGSPEN